MDKMDKNVIGIWSGIVWRALNERGKLSREELKQVTNFESECIYAAIGWLAREGNISFDNGSKGLLLYIYHERYY